MSSSIITASDLDTYTKKTLEPSIAADVVNGINAWIESRTGRSFGGTTQATEYHDIEGSVWLRHQDVVSIDSVTVQMTPTSSVQSFDETTYKWNSLGRLTFYYGLNMPNTIWSRDALCVQYTYGTATVPEDLKLAALGIAAQVYNFVVNGNQDVVSSSLGAFRVEYITAVRASAASQKNVNNTTESLFAIIDSYRPPRLR